MSALDKVLRLSAAAGPESDEPEGVQYVRAAARALDELSLELAKKRADAEESDDEDYDGLGDSKSDGGDDDEGDSKAPAKRKKKPGKKKDGDMAKCSALVLEAMLAVHELAGGETISLSVLTAAERRKPSAHTISGSEDFPIPDKGHLSAAIARYKEGKLAGHSASEVKAHILASAKRLGVQVELSDLQTGDSATIVRLARGMASDMRKGSNGVPMEHGAHNGEHSHPYRAVHVVDGPHYHNNDSRHGGDGYGGGY